MLYSKLQELNTDIWIVLSGDEIQVKQFEEEYANNKFPIYYDETGAARKPLKQEFVPKRGMMPAILIIDKYGLIQYAYYADSPDDFPEEGALVKNLHNIQE